MKQEASDTSPRLAVVCDYPEESWTSMDLCAEMLLDCLTRRHAGEVRVTRVCPPFRRRLGRIPGLGRSGMTHNVDRLLNRLWDYPRALRRVRAGHDLFHLVDHSYAQLLHALPAGRCGVHVQDLDTFRCVLEPERDPRPRWFRAMTRHVLSGLRKAAVVFFSTRPTEEEILKHRLIDPARLVHAPLGTAPEFQPDPPAGWDDGRSTPAGRFLLHVGSCIPRKRMDVLLDVFAGLRREHPDLTLVKVGGAWTAEQRAQIRRAELDDAIAVQPHLDRRRLASLYRRAAVVLQPSEAEGFGLPVLEALACGAVVCASDIGPHREVAEGAAVFCPVGDVPTWTATVHGLLDNPDRAPSRDARLARAGRFSWESHTRIIVDAYLRLVAAGG